MKSEVDSKNMNTLQSTMAQTLRLVKEYLRLVKEYQPAEYDKALYLAHKIETLVCQEQATSLIAMLAFMALITVGWEQLEEIVCGTEAIKHFGQVSGISEREDIVKQYCYDQDKKANS